MRAELNQFAKAADRGIATRLGLGAVQEGVLQELPQSVQEQMFQNWGGGKPIIEGVARSAIEGTLAGSVMGGGNILHGHDHCFCTPAERGTLNLTFFTHYYLIIMSSCTFAYLIRFYTLIFLPR